MIWLTGATEAAIKFIEANAAKSQVLQALPGEILLASRSYEEYQKQLRATVAEMGYYIGANGDLMSGQTVLIKNYAIVNEHQYALEQGMARVDAATQAATVTVKNQADAADVLRRSYGLTTTAVDKFAEAEAKAKAEAEKLNQALSDLKLFVGGPLGKETENFTKKEEELAQQAAELRTEISKMGGLDFMTPAQQSQIADMQNELNGVIGGMGRLRDVLEKGGVSGGLIKKFLAGDLELSEIPRSLRDEALALDELYTRAGSLESQITKLGGKPYMTDAQKKQLEDLRGELADTNDAIAANADAHDEATRRILFDLLTQRAAVGGTTDAELKALTDIALKWGLIDQATADATLSMDKSMRDLAAGESITEVTNQILALHAAINGIPTSKTFTLELIVKGKLPSSYQTPDMGIPGDDGGSGGGGTSIPGPVYIPPGPDEQGPTFRGAAPVIDGGTTIINVYGSPGQSVTSLAEAVADIIDRRKRSNARSGAHMIGTH